MSLSPERPLQDVVVSEASRFGLPLSGVQVERLARYLALVERWGQRLNLTGRPEAAVLAERQLADALVLAHLIPTFAPAPTTVIDVGAGAGLVGVPLLILCPRLELTLVEPTQRKCAFLRTALHDLSLQAQVAPTRLEHLSLESTFSLVLSRATWAPSTWVELGAPLVAPGGRLLCFLARDETPEGDGLEREQLVSYQLSDQSPRSLLVLRRR